MFDKVKHFAKEKIPKEKNRRIIFVVLVILLLSLVFSLFSSLLNLQGKFSEYSVSNESKNRVYFNLNSANGILYKSKEKGEKAVFDFIKKGGPVKSKGQILPKDFSNNSNINKITKDSELNPEYVSNSSSKEHYSFEQTINGIPIYGASLIVHLQNGNEIYSVSGNLVIDSKITSQKISEEVAETNAFNAAKKETKADDLQFASSKKEILNFKILGLKDDPLNYLVQEVQIDAESVNFSTRYFVSLENGEVLYKENLQLEVKQRNAYDCQNNSNPTNCPLVRQEGGSASGISDVDEIFGYMGEVYDFYKTNFNRDGLDGVGSPLEGFVRIYSVGGKPCAAQKNAYHSSLGFMAYCAGAVARDITAHEFSHGVVGATVGLAQGYQYGALNESIADSLAASLDGNWTMGEGSFLGIIRNMSNPPSVSDFTGPQPDKLFSTYYDCGEEVHHNSTIPSKAFYLMTDGGNFNGCSINGVGIDRAKQILYKTLASQYIPSTANFYDMYSGINQACGDLYGSGSDVCKEVQKAYQAVEMDQQQAGSARGAKCTGATEKAATCAGQPSSNPIPTNTPTSTPSPTLAVGETPTNTPTPKSISTPTPSGTIFKPIGSPTPTPDQYYTCEPDPKCANNEKSIQLCPLVCHPK